MTTPDDEKDFFLCEDCVMDKHLKVLIRKHACSVNNCVICLQNKATANITTQEIIDFSRFLIRYNYPEYEYNPHWGGEDLPSQLYQPNLILSNEFANFDDGDRQQDIEDFLHLLFDWRIIESPVEVYWGFDDYGRGLYGSAIKDEKSKIWEGFKKHLQTRNYHLIEEEAKKELALFLNELSSILPKDTEFIRARIGFVPEAKHLEGYSKALEVKAPYSGNSISAPPPMKARAGRANRQGVSYLYLASDKETALGEVRPHPGHYVSLGKFKTLKQLKVVDLRNIDLLKYFSTEDKLEIFKLLRDLAEELSIPILPEEQENYLVTQFISDIIRQLGYEGVLFNSSVSGGYNLVAFDSENFEFVNESSELLKVTKVKYDYKKTEFDFDGFSEKAIEK